MKKTILTIAIVSLFLMTGFSSAFSIFDNDGESRKTDYEPPDHWEKPKAYFSLHNWSEENLEVTVDGERVDDFTYFTDNPYKKFKNVEITFQQEEYLSLAWTYFLHPFLMYKWGIMFKVMLKVIPKFLANLKDFDKTMDEVFNDAFYEVIENNSNISYYFKKGYTYSISIGTLSGVKAHSLTGMSNTIEFNGEDKVIIDLVEN